MTAVSFHIHAPLDDPSGQRAALALAPRGTGYRWHAAATRCLKVRHADGSLEVAEDPLAMIELIEAHHPDQPLHPRDADRLILHRSLMAASLSAERRLDGLLAAQGTGDLDLALHFLFRSLETIEAGIEPPPRSGRQPLSNLDVMLAPLLWRIVALDRTAATFVLAPLPRLAARAHWLQQQIEVAELFDAAAAGRLADHLRAALAGALAPVQEDWSRALGPEGGERGAIDLSRAQGR